MYEIYMKACHLTIKGKVQGVYFRQSAKQKAFELNITGWVRNNPDNIVEIFAQGNEENMHVFIAWCHQGPPAARVSAVIVTETAADNSSSFIIIR